MQEEEPQKLVSRMIASAQGGTGQLHKITEPTAWRGEVQILHEEENVKPSARCEEKRKELAKHWHSDTEVQVFFFFKKKQAMEKSGVAKFGGRNANFETRWVREGSEELQGKDRSRM